MNWRSAKSTAVVAAIRAAEAVSIRLRDGEQRRSLSASAEPARSAMMTVSCRFASAEDPSRGCSVWLAVTPSVARDEPNVNRHRRADQSRSAVPVSKGRRNKSPRPDGRLVGDRRGH